MTQQTFFESAHVLENAEVMLALCREEYERAGFLEDAQALRGLEVNSPTSAQLALLTVNSLQIDPRVADVRRYTLNALSAACKAGAKRAPVRLAS